MVTKTLEKKFCTSKKVLTLVVVHEELKNRVLLGYKKRGFGQGKINGFGGKVEKNETIYEGAERELTEESSIISKELDKVGLLWFTFENDPVGLEVHVFKCSRFEGEPQESDEMRPAWYNVQDIPYDKMWEDDKFWLPRVIEGKKVIGKFWFGEDQKTIINHVMDENACMKGSDTGFDIMARDNYWWGNEIVKN